MQSYSDLEPAVKHLSYFKDLRERRSWMARVTVVVALVGMLGLNIYLLFLSTDIIVMNVDQARLEQDDLANQTSARIDHLEQEIAALRAVLEPAEEPAVVNESETETGR